jgi:hypothetical protein
LGFAGSTQRGLARSYEMAQEFYGATVEAQHTINKLLLLPASGREQDWEFEFADPYRIDEMLSVASANDLNTDEKCALVLLIIASIDEAVEIGKVKPENIEQVKSILEQDDKVRDAMIFYWIDQNRSNAEAVEKMLLG